MKLPPFLATFFLLFPPIAVLALSTCISRSRFLSSMAGSFSAAAVLDPQGCEARDLLKVGSGSLPKGSNPRYLDYELEMKYADDKSIPFVVIIGEDEKASNSLTLKCMSSGAQTQLKKAELKDHLSE